MVCPVESNDERMFDHGQNLPFTFHVLSLHTRTERESQGNTETV